MSYPIRARENLKHQIAVPQEKIAVLQNQIAVPHAAKQLVLLHAERLISAKAWLISAKAWLIFAKA